MNVINRYAEYALKVTGAYEQNDDNIERLNYISKEELMLRGNNRKNTYNSERVRIGSNGRKR